MIFRFLFYTNIVIWAQRGPVPGFGNRPMPGFGGMDNKVDTSVEEPVVELPECKIFFAKKIVTKN